MGGHYMQIVQAWYVTNLQDFRPTTAAVELRFKVKDLVDQALGSERNQVPMLTPEQPPPQLPSYASHLALWNKMSELADRLQRYPNYDPEHLWSSIVGGATGETVLI